MCPFNWHLWWHLHNLTSMISMNNPWKIHFLAYNINSFIFYYILWKTIFRKRIICNKSCRTCSRHDAIFLGTKAVNCLRRDVIFCAKTLQTRGVQETHVERWWATFPAPVHTLGNPCQACKISFVISLKTAISLQKW